MNSDSPSDFQSKSCLPCSAAPSTDMNSIRGRTVGGEDWLGPHAHPTPPPLVLRAARDTLGGRGCFDFAIRSRSLQGVDLILGDRRIGHLKMLQLLEPGQR
jgi:hypothetical protein